MNLTVKASLEGMMNHIVTLDGTMKDSLEQTVEIAAMREDLSCALQTCKSFITAIDDLSVAEESLSVCGFTDKWLDCINADGKFLDAVNIDMAKIVGTPAEKTQAAMEGLWDTIKSVIVKIWEFIVNTFNKIVDFIKRLIAAYKVNDLEKKIEHTAYAIMNSDNPDEAYASMLQKVNESGRGGKAFDLRDLITRMTACMSVIGYITFNWDDVFGMTEANTSSNDPFSGMFSEDFVAKFRRDKNVIGGRVDMNNGIFENFAKDIHQNPSKITPGVLGWSNFAPSRNANGYDAEMKKAGINIVGGETGYVVEDLEKSCQRIDYVGVYKVSKADANNPFHSVCKQAQTTIEQFADDKAYMSRLDTMKRAMEHAKKLVKDADLGAYNSDNGELVTPEQDSLIHRPARLHAARAQAKWLAEAVTLIGRCSSEYGKALTEVARIVQVGANYKF